MGSPYLELAISTAREAGKLIRDGAQNMGSVRSSRKKGSWVTNVDRESERLVRDLLAARHPDHGFLGEESGLAGNPDRCWVVDPLDGTTNFVHGFPGYCISLAFVVDGRSVVGVVYDVSRDDLYASERGQGLHVNGRRRKARRTELLSEALLISVGGLGPDRWMREMVAAISRKSQGVRRSGSSALDLAMVAAGNFDGFFGHGMRYWDYAAGALMLQESGAVIAPVDEDAYRFGETTGFLVGGLAPLAMELRKQARRTRDGQGG